jgi:uncharacterized RDD family membrane protein YckC
VIIKAPPASLLPQVTQAPSFIKLGASLFYELLVLIALAFFSVGIFYIIFGDATHGVKRVFLQLFVWLLMGAYFVRSWVVRGQTLAMRSWGLRLIDANHLNASSQTMDWQKALLRYVLVSLNLALFGLGFFYCFFDVDKRFLHDKLLNTKIITLK